ncbi:hypothetical protein CFD26_102681 [Aspergillus turcosus]|uniref:Transcription factor domain-containing protein n=1 Tax=Aspergillus turcosus TaxID=1245748 RepID=A0A421CWB6_9EURO|nr:hypothetical protein CFD26_102681 [Aspergillus turcosus]
MGLDLDLGLTEADLEFLGSLNDDNMISQRPSITPEKQPQAGSLDSVGSTHRKPCSQLSSWSPRSKDNAYMDQEYLSVPKDLDHSIAEHATARSRVLPEHLSRERRDLAFAVVVRICGQRNFDRLMHCFPSAELLDSLIQDFFIRQRNEVDSWIHEPTMHLNQESPVMIITLAAAGAVMSSVDALQRLGYALLEIARIQLSQDYESDNSLTRHLRAQQAYALVLQIGLWSGNKRRVEIAESFEQPLVTMLRRASLFKKEKYSALMPPSTDDEETLNSHWRRWAESESFNSSRNLWDARTAAEWKSLCLKEDFQSADSPLSLADILQGPPLLWQIPLQSDVSLTALVYIHGISKMVADCNRNRYERCGAWSNPLFQLWQRELQDILERFGIEVLGTLGTQNSIMALIHQAISLSVYIPLGALEVLAGKDGEESAAHVRQTIVRSISPSHFRQAIWHAGQVLRISKTMASGSLIRFCATCLYFAALALWTYGTLSPRGVLSLDASELDTTEQRDVFLLDEVVDDLALRHFIVSGKRTPALSSERGPVSLDDRVAVVHIFQDALRSNHLGRKVSQQIQTFHDVLSALEYFSRINHDKSRKRKAL